MRCQGSFTTVFGTMGTTVVPPGLFWAFPSRCPATRVSDAPLQVPVKAIGTAASLDASLLALQVHHRQLRCCPAHQEPSILEGD